MGRRGGGGDADRHLRHQPGQRRERELHRGFVASGGFAAHHACAWSIGGDSFTVLEPPGFVSSEAVACNDTHILGFARDAAGGSAHPALERPRPGERR